MSALAQTPPRLPRPSLGRLLGRLDLALSLAFLLLVLLWALWPEPFLTHDPNQTRPRDRFLAPGPSYWLGSDYLGRDLYSRIVAGARASILAALLAIGIGALGGGLLGVIGALAKGWAGALVMRLIDVLLALPGLLIALVLITAFGSGPDAIALAMGVGLIGPFARLARSEVLRVRAAPYVEAARISGAGPVRLLAGHILPNAAPAFLAYVVLEFGTAILAISALSFLGYGSAPPAPEWGSLVANGSAYMAVAWWPIFFPGLVVVAVAIAAARVSRHILDRFQRISPQ